MIIRIKNENLCDLLDLFSRAIVKKIYFNFYRDELYLDCNKSYIKEPSLSNAKIISENQFNINNYLIFNIQDFYEYSL